MKRYTLATCLALVPFLASAQDAPKEPPSLNASISGMVKDSVSGKALADYVISTDIKATPNVPAKEVKSTTDESGRYKLSDLPPGSYRLSAHHTQFFGTETSKRVTLAGHDIEALDFRVVVNGTISGKVFDENKEPVPNMTVLLVSKEYFLGTVGYFLKSAGRTNDRGEYKMTRVEAGHPYLLLAENRVFKLPAHSEAPLNPKLRRRVPMRTWYLNSPVKEGAVSVTLRPGEEREGVDIEVKKSASYCIDGVMSTPNGPGVLNFSIEAQQPASGPSASSAMYMRAPGGVTGADGKFRICDLYPGAYRLLAMEQSSPNGPPPYYSATTIVISDRDLTGFKLAASGGLDISGEVILEGPQPAQPIPDKVTVYPAPRFRSSYGENTGGRYEIPGNFTWKGMMVDEYAMRATVNSAGLYVKDVTYADRSVMYEPLQLGSAPADAGLKVIIAQDGATLSVRVADKDGNPVPDSKVVVMPADAVSEGVLAARLISGQTDQAGQYTTPALPPGKYYAAANAESTNATEENIGKLWRSRNHFTEIMLPPGGKVQVNLAPLP